MIKWTNRERQILRQLEISGDINAEYQQQPGIRARYGFMLARANMEVARLKERLKIVEDEAAGRAKRAIRRKRIDQADDEAVRVYRWEIERAVSRDTERIRTAKALRSAQFDAEILKHAIASIETKKEMLISYGAQLREEHGSYISLLKKQASGRIGKRKRGSDGSQEEEG